MRVGMNRREFLKHTAMAVAAVSPSSQLVRRVTAELNTIDEGSVRRLASSLRGQVLLPGDRSYESACQNWTGAVLKRPGFIVQPDGNQDVVTAVKFARDHDLLVAVRGGGHSLNSSCDGGMLINLGKMRRVEVNRARRTARAEAGLTAGELDRATCANGLATVLGECPSVGLSGLTLGGGLGRLMGTHGTLCDNLLSAQVVTAEGKVLAARAGQNDDLFWGIRGGGGNLGVVTSFEYRLHLIGDVLSGTLRYPISRVESVLRFFGEYMVTAPDELDALVEIGSGILQYAPAAQEPTVVVNVCCGGNLKAAAKALLPLRSLGPPEADTIRPMSYLQAQQLGDLKPLLNHLTDKYSGYSKLGFVTQLNDKVIDSIIAHCEKPPSQLWSVALDHYMHGESCRVPETAMAFSLRQAGYSFRLTAREEQPGPADTSVAWVKSLHGALQPFSGGRIYLNYLTDEGEEGVRAAFGNNYRRLVALKRKYDPTNFFRVNPNIVPWPS